MIDIFPNPPKEWLKITVYLLLLPINERMSPVFKGGIFHRKCHNKIFQPSNFQAFLLVFRGSEGSEIQHQLIARIHPTYSVTPKHPRWLDGIANNFLSHQPGGC